MEYTLNPVKEEFRDQTSVLWEAPPRPMERLHDSVPQPFLTKTFDMVDDQDTDRLLSWSDAGNSFVVWDPQTFAIAMLPKHFKHSNFSSFIRQLNTYGFRKVNPGRWEFANASFLKGQKHLLKNIKRRRPPLGACFQVGQLGFDEDIESLKGDKVTLVVELVKLKQEQQRARVQLRAMEERLQETEQKQQQVMAFLARTMRNPDFLQQIVQQERPRKEFDEAISKKKRRPMWNEDDNCDEGARGNQEEFKAPTQGTHTHDGELSYEFWEELLNEEIVEDDISDCEEKTKI